jgi:hypothetical protein
MASCCRQGLSARNTPALALTMVSGAPHCAIAWQQTWTTGMGQRQMDDVLLNVPGQEAFHGRLPPPMGQGTLIDEA